MADKIIFTMQVFLLGISVVMLVLFSLYGLITLFNWLRSRLLEKEGPAEPLTAEWDRLPPQLVAAVTAALNHYRTAASGYSGPVRVQVDLQQAKGSRWAAAGRRALLVNSSELGNIRRKR